MKAAAVMWFAVGVIMFAEPLLTIIAFAVWEKFLIYGVVLAIALTIAALLSRELGRGNDQ